MTECNCKYYVYEHIRLDNNTCFYVGKGSGERYKKIKRNEHHDRIAAKYGMKSVIIKDNLSEQEAYDLERSIICNYVFNLGYGIDIDGYRNSNKLYLTNLNFGGEGNYGVPHSDEWRKQHSIDMSGSNNPMYGVNVWDFISEETKKRLREDNSIRYSGANNPMYGISPANRMDDETYKEWRSKLVKRLKNQTGENNPNYGNHTLHNKIKDNPELRIQYFARNGIQNGRATKVQLYDINGFIKEFDYIKLCAEWIKETLQLSTSVKVILSGISTAVKNGKTYRGFTFKYLK